MHNVSRLDIPAWAWCVDKNIMRIEHIRHTYKYNGSSNLASCTFDFLPYFSIMACYIDLYRLLQQFLRFYVVVYHTCICCSLLVPPPTPSPSPTKSLDQLHQLIQWHAEHLYRKISEKAARYQEHYSETNRDAILRSVPHRRSVHKGRENREKPNRSHNQKAMKEQ